MSAERENASAALPITKGARVIDSTPPAIAKSISPERIARPAAPTASSPDAQRRLRVWPGTDSGRPASSSAMRATLRLSSPAWLAQPKNTSSTETQSSLGCLAISALIGAAARSSARTLASAPPKRPIGVLTASQTKTSRICFLPQCRIRPQLMASFRSGPQRGQLRVLQPASRGAGQLCPFRVAERGKPRYLPQSDRTRVRNWLVCASNSVSQNVENPDTSRKAIGRAYEIG